MPIPELTHLQALVLEGIGEGQTLGIEIREHLRKHESPVNGPAFYQLMGRLEERGLVEGERADKSRLYRVTAAGFRACREAVAFYLERNF